MKKKSIWLCIASIVLAEAVGALSGLLAGDISAVYGAFQKPPLSPPGWLFPVMWGILYALMGVSAYLIYTADADARSKRNALLFYAGQLFVNFLWSIVFFRFQWLGGGVLVLTAMIALLGAMLFLFYHIRPLAAWLQGLYILWSLFALYLSMGIYLLNT